MSSRSILLGYTTMEQDNTGVLFWQVSQVWSQRQDVILKKVFKISQLHYIILTSIHWLQSHDKEVTQSLLSRHTKMDKMTISKNISTLEERGYICRKCHSSDARANAVYLTPYGIDLLEEVIELVIEFDRKFFISLGKNIQSFNKKLTALIKHHEKNMGNGYSIKI